MVNKHSAVKKDDTLVRQQDENSRPAMDAVDGDNDSDVHHHKKPAHSPSNFSPSFHRPFLDVEEDSPAPEKLYKVCVGGVQNGICAVPLRRDSLSTLLRKTKTPVSSSQSAGSTSEDSGGSCCEVGELDEQRTCKGEGRERRNDDGGRDERLHAALGLISLADVSVDVAQVQLKSSTETPTEDCDDAKQPCISSRETEAAVNAASKPSTGLNCDIVMSRHSKFVWPGIDAILEAYASHVEELHLERQCLQEQRQQLELHHSELTATAESLTGELQTAETLQNELDQELRRLRHAIDNLKHCLRPFLA